SRRRMAPRSRPSSASSSSTCTVIARGWNGRSTCVWREAISTGRGCARPPPAVAQALRWNPLPIVVPCHRIIGASGALTGYSGNKIELKRDLLAVEGIRAVGARDGHVARQALYHYERNEQREYCLPTCGDIARRPIGRVTLMASRDLAASLGLVPSPSCPP